MMDEKNRSMWAFPWSLKESFAIATGLLLCGFALEASTDSTLPNIAFPYNLISGSVFICILFVLHFRYKKSPIIKWLESTPAAISAITLFTVLSLLIGFIPQQTNTSNIEKNIIGLSTITHSRSYLLSQIYFLTTLGLVSIKRSFPFQKNNIGFILNHLGLWIIVFAAALGSGDMQRITIEAREDLYTSTGYINGKDPVRIPMEIKLDQFKMKVYPPKILLSDSDGIIISSKKSQNTEIIEGVKIKLNEFTIEVKKYIPLAAPLDNKYELWPSKGGTPAAFIIYTKNQYCDSGWISCGSFMYQPKIIEAFNGNYLIMEEPSPKSYVSSLSIKYKGQISKDSLAVNSPLKIDGAKMYQLSYNSEQGQWSEVSIIELIRDPWLPVIYTGIFMLIVGVIYNIFKGKRTNSEN